MYGDAFVDRAVERHGGLDADLMATLTEFVARTVALGIRQCDALGPPVEEIVAAGGGVKNPVLMERIAALIAPVPVRRSDELGVPSDAREAMAFAVLADMTLRGSAAHLPPVTGAAAPSCWEAVVPLGLQDPRLYAPSGVSSCPRIRSTSRAPWRTRMTMIPSVRGL